VLRAVAKSVEEVITAIGFSGFFPLLESGKTTT
jgi:hypothetical protein